MCLPKLFGIISLLFSSTVASPDLNRFYKHQEARRFQSGDGYSNVASECNSTSCYRYYNAQTAPYFIEQWPDAAFDTGEFYSGSVPIDESNPNRTLFFVFKPAAQEPVDEITIWLNGGPGCSSLFGFFSENGPISWRPGSPTGRHIKNEWAWSEMTNMIWVDNPVGVGFSKGRITARNEDGVAKDFLGFFENFQKLFGIKNYKIYITGESYAGKYVPYIGSNMLDRNDKTYFGLSGILLYDACIGDCGLLQLQWPTYYFVEANNYLLNLNQSYLDKMQKAASDCGQLDYLDRYLQFPPPGHQPPFPLSDLVQPIECDIPLMFAFGIYPVNPCFNGYFIADTCPSRSNLNDHFFYLYFNRKDVKEAIHAPMDVRWLECGEHDGFVNDNDTSPQTIFEALPRVIEATNRVLIANGEWDNLVMSNGTLLAIQNMTWAGKLGFQEAPSKDFVVPLKDTFPPYYNGPQGIMGTQHYERGLQWVNVAQAGHEGPMYQPRAAWRHLQWVLGRIDTL